MQHLLTRLLLRVPATPPTGIKDFALPCGYVPVVALARGIGVWKFKGNPAPLAMVQVQAVTLQGRSYPSEPPKGKVRGPQGF
jgi:hypothetical protein